LRAWEHFSRITPKYGFHMSEQTNSIFAASYGNRFRHVAVKLQRHLRPRVSRAKDRAHAVDASECEIRCLVAPMIHRGLIDGAQHAVNVIWVVVFDAGGLPAQEVSSAIRPIALDAVQVHAPASALPDRCLADRVQRHPRCGVPDMRPIIDPRGRFPFGPPIAIVALTAQINGKIDPIAGRRNFKLAVFSYLLPIGSQ